MAEPTTATTTSDFAGFLKPDQAAPYFAAARKASILQTLAREVPLGANGVEVPVVTSKATASWVGEGGRKPLSNGALALKSMAPKKIAAIAVVSAEVVRANPQNYIQLFKDDVAEAMAIAFDLAGFHGTNSPFGAGMNLDASARTPIELGTTTKANGGIYGDFVAGFAALTAAKKRLRGFAFDGSIEAKILGAVDNNGRPIFEATLDDSTGPITSGRLLRRPAVLADIDSAIATAIVPDDDGAGPHVVHGGVVGYAGDFSQVVWGKVGGITYDVSTEATVTINGVLTSLWEHNLVAIRAEAEFGLLINDVDAFVPFTDNS